MMIENERPTPNVRSCLVWLVAAGLFGACSGDHVLGVVGDAAAPLSNTGAGGATGGGAANPACTSYRAPAGTGGYGAEMNFNAGSASATPPAPGSLGPTQRWTGYAERLTYSSGSDSIKLTVASDSAGNVAGTVVFGKGAPPAPATDPNIGYPPTGQNAFPAEGFVYQMNAAKITAQRLTFHVGLRQFWSTWCALQTPVAPGEKSCAPNGTFVNTSAGCTFRSSCGGTLSCEKVQMCSNLCYCSGETCQVILDLGPDRPLNDMYFDLFLTGEVANGTASGENFIPSAAHFTKDPAADGGT